jgi:glycosyltransferase involved in cell wall biosynthesis
MPTDPILFVSHDASATGAPFLLLQLLRWLRDNTALDFKVILSKPGPLREKFAELAPVVVVERSADSLFGRAVEFTRSYRLAHMLDRVALRKALGALGNDRFALIYSNTLVNGKLLEHLDDHDCPVISHVHELEYMIQRTAPEHLASTLRRTVQFIAGSDAVARNLVENHGIHAERIEVLHEFIAVSDLNPDRLTGSALRIRAELGIPDDAFVAGAAGTVDWRKGYDLFIPLVLEVLRADPRADMHFVWVGGYWDRRTSVEIAYDLRKLGLEQRVHFVGHRSNYLEYIATFDALCLTSREDPFPLVMLESAALGKPIICFTTSGGASEFVEKDSGFVVPYLDVREMATRLIELRSNPALREQMGRCCKSKVRDRHDVGVIAPRIFEIIQRCA